VIDQEITKVDSWMRCNKLSLNCTLDISSEVE